MKILQVFEKKVSVLPSLGKKQLEYLRSARTMADFNLDVPKAKVSCLLCRGFVGYKNSDRTRFKEHMEEEHEVQYDSDLVLAVSVLCREDRETIVKAVLPRLERIGKGELALTVSLLVPLLAPGKSVGSVPPTLVKEEKVVVKEEDDTEKMNVEERDGGKRGNLTAGQMDVRIEGGVAPSFARGRGGGRPPAGRGTPRRGAPPSRGAPSPRGGVPTPRGSAAPPRGLPQRPQSPLVMAPPRALHGNIAISVSVVDQSTPCSTCGLVFPTRDAMSEHMKATHLNKYAGLSIATPRDTRDGSRPKESPLVRREAPPMRSPVVRDVRDVMREASKQTNKEKNQFRYNSSGAGKRQELPSQVGRILSSSSPSPKPPSSHLPQKSLEEPHIKCSTCGALVKKSQFPAHKAVHVEEEEVEDGEKQADHVDMEGEMDAESLMVEEQVRDEVESMETHELMDNLINFLDEF